MSYRVYVSEGPPFEFPDVAPMVIDGSDYVFVIGDDELARIRADEVRDVEVVPDSASAEIGHVSHVAA
jgi:hypothetical protein